ncbi:MAG TPA: carboxypeptidase-like regulatory domain-containing protein, partial [Pedobacter sp.]
MKTAFLLKLMLFCAALLIFNHGFVTAQTVEKTVTGKVTEETGGPLPGTTVMVKGTKRTVVTIDNGTFSIKVPGPESVLVFSFIGYNTQEVVVGNKASVEVQLTPDDQARRLNDVVVIGYGTQKKVNLTGAVSTVSGDDLIKRPVVSTASMLEGTMPGVQVSQGSGEPGNEGVSIRIRG